MRAAHLGDPQVVYPSTTPLRIAFFFSVHRPKVGCDRERKESEVKSIPRSLGSITIGDGSEDLSEGVVKANVDGQNHVKQTSQLPFKDQKPHAALIC